MKRIALYLTLAALLGLSWSLHEAPPASRAVSPLRRVLAPVADLVADIEWIRFQRAILEGRHAHALARAESALSFAPERPAGWEILASHLGLYLASQERETDPERRLAWVRASLATLDRASEAIEGGGASQGELAYLGGLILLTHAEQDPDLPWPGGRPALWEAVREAGEKAASLGHGGGADLAGYAEDALAGLRSD